MAVKEDRIEKYFNELLRSGSDIKEVERLKNECVELLKKDRSMREITDEIARKTSENTSEFLYNNNKNGDRYITGISSCMYFDDLNFSPTTLKFIGGSRNYRNSSNNKPIVEDTMFDVASITKLFTLILAYECETLGLNLNTQVRAIMPEYNLGDFTFNDLIRLCGDIATDGRINDAKDEEEAYKILKTAYLKDNTRRENKYTDIGSIIIGEALVKVLNETRGVIFTLEEWMNLMIFEPLGMRNTKFNPQIDNITGCGNRLEVHDPKARALGGVAGHAGIFTTSDDLCKLANGIFRIKHNKRRVLAGNLELTKEQISKFGEVTFPSAKQCNKGNLGIYVKHPDGFARTFTPSIFSMGSFSHQGWTGSLATFDPNNLIHQNILVNAIYEPDNKELIRNDKAVGFGGEFDKYLDKFTMDTMLMWVAKRYYDDYINIMHNDEVMYSNKTYRI